MAENDFWLELSGVSKKLRVEKSECDCVLPVMKVKYVSRNPTKAKTAELTSSLSESTLKLTLNGNCESAVTLSSDEY